MTALLYMAAFPFVTFLTVKLGVYAFYKGRWQFQRDLDSGRLR